MIRFIIGVVLSIIFLYFVVTGLQQYMEDQKALEEAQRQVDIAQAEYNKSQEELKAVLDTATSNKENIAKAYERYKAAQERVLAEETE